MLYRKVTAIVESKEPKERKINLDVERSASFPIRITRRSNGKLVLVIKPDPLRLTAEWSQGTKHSSTQH